MVRVEVDGGVRVVERHVQRKRAPVLESGRPSQGEAQAAHGSVHKMSLPSEARMVVHGSVGKTVVASEAWMVIHGSVHVTARSALSWFLQTMVRQGAFPKHQGECHGCQFVSQDRQGSHASVLQVLARERL